MKNIVILDGYTLNPGDLSWNKLHALGKVTTYQRTKKEEIKDRIIDAEIIVVNKVRLDAETIESAPKCQCICVTATGYNNIDLQKAREKNIAVMNASNYGTLSVAQHVFALLLEITNNIYIHNQSVKGGEWGNQPDFCYWRKPLERLEGKTLGIIGFGTIGQAVAKIAVAFGMEVKVTTRNIEKAKKMGFDAMPLGEIIPVSDIITLHLPLTEETRHIMNKGIFQKMKENVILINTSRGDLINEDDLFQGLQENKPGYAALDVLKEEPPVQKSPLFVLDNCLITPHIAWASKQARERLMDITAENIHKFIEGKPINNLAELK
jgi:glycerate dehydrogenase